MPTAPPADSSPAHTLWVELSTRITTERLHYRSGDEETAAASVYKLFGRTRELMEKNPEAIEFQGLALALLNKTLRPFTARWHGWMTVDDSVRDKDGQPQLRFRDEWVRRQFRRELQTLQPRLAGFRKAFEALKDGATPESWWTSPNESQFQKLRKELADQAEVNLGAALPCGIQDQVGFAHMEEDDRKVLCAKINEAEHGEIRRKRGMVDGEPIVNAAALAFSGGGIRSATFCLGITEVLARRGMLRQFDYLSTVSGGGYFGSFLSAYLGTGDRLKQPSSGKEDESREAKRQREWKDERAEVEARIAHTFLPGPDRREPLPLRHLRNRSRYLSDGGFVRGCVEVGMVVAGILFNLLIVLPVPLVAALLTVSLYRSRLLGDYDWGNRSLPEPGAPGNIVLLTLLVVMSFALLAYPSLKARSLKSLRRSKDSNPFSYWFKVFPWLAALTIFALMCWLIPVGFHLYHLGRTGEVNSWLGKLKEHLPSVSGVTLATLLGLLGTLASRVKNNRSAGGILKHLAILSGPLFFLLVYLEVGHRMILEQDLQKWPWVWVLWSTAAMVVWAWLFVDINTYSPHGYYRDRLSDCYLRARKKGAAGDEEPNDDDPAHVDRLRWTELNACTAAPYHLMNATVNLPSSHLREIRGRNGDFFLFSKHFSGSPMCGYYPTAELEEADPHFDLGTAMAISGAAASSNMGWQTNNAIRLILTMANVRLGYWLRNPRLGIEKTKKMPGPGPLYLFREMFASGMDESRSYLNLSDGGHIENLAVYELLRRRCKFIVCVDGGMEPGMECADLIRLERYAAIDLGIKLHYDLTDLMLQPNGYSNTYGLLVKIDYNPPATEAERRDRDPNDAEWGWMLYMKLSMIGYGPGYVMDYKRQHGDFPHQSTSNQIYDEAQFEAYRALGEVAGESFFSQELIEGHDVKRVKGWFTALATSLLPDNDEVFHRTQAMSRVATKCP
jgi:hypothetical protein